MTVPNPTQQSVTQLDHALEYARLGYYVIPLCWPNAHGACACGRHHKINEVGKTPLIAKTQGENDLDGAYAGLSLENTIRYWWKRWPDANIGISLEASGLMTIAPDSVLWAEQFTTDGLPETTWWMSGGGSGHWHKLYRIPGDCPHNKINKPGEYDIIVNGIAVAPPSMHRLGVPYTLLSDLIPVADLPFAPQWAVEMLTKAIYTSVPKPVPAGGPMGVIIADDPPVILAGKDLALWEGREYIQNGTGPDRSKTLYAVASMLSKGLTGDPEKNRDILAASIKHYDERAFSDPKYANRKDSGWTEYYRLADKLIGPVYEPEPVAPAPPQSPPPTPPASVSGSAQPSAKPSKIPMNLIEDAFSKNEVGDAELFARMLHGRFAYDHQEGEWYCYRDHAWHKDTDDQIRIRVSTDLALRYIEYQSHLIEEAKDLLANGEDEKSKDIKKKADKVWDRVFALRSKKRIDSVLFEARSRLGATAYGHPDGQLPWDADPWLLGVENGVIDLKTGNCRDGDPKDWIRTVAPARWEGIRARSPTWRKFQREIYCGVSRAGDASPDDVEVMKFVQRLHGYGITGLVNERKFVIEHGVNGDNGKDTQHGALRSVLGDYAAVVETDVFAEKHEGATGGATPHLIPLRGKRIVVASETSKTSKLNVNQVKQITSGKEMRCRNVHEKSVSFIPTHLPFLMTNHKLSIEDNGDSTWTRLIYLVYKYSFVEEVTNPEYQRKYDPDLSAKLDKERSGILAHLVRGCLRYQKYGLKQPDSVKLDVAEYRKESNKDDMTVREFDSENITDCTNSRLTSDEILKEYMSYCAMRSLTPVSSNEFYKKFKQLHPSRSKRDSKGAYYKDLAFFIPEPDEDDN